MTNQDAIYILSGLRKSLHEYCGLNDNAHKAFDMAISALQEKDSKTKRCATCKHNPPSKKWPCEDCDMRESADRWEPKEAKDKDDGDLQPTCNHLISRQEVIDALWKNLRRQHDI